MAKKGEKPIKLSQRKKENKREASYIKRTGKISKKVKSDERKRTLQAY